MKEVHWLLKNATYRFSSSKNLDLRKKFEILEENKGHKRMQFTESKLQDTSLAWSRFRTTLYQPIH